MNPKFDAVVKRTNLTGRLVRETESLTLDHWQASLRVSAKVFKTECCSALIVVLCSAVPAGKALAVVEQLEEILRIRGMRILNRVVKPDLSTRIRRNVAGDARVILRRN